MNRFDRFTVIFMLVGSILTTGCAQMQNVGVGALAGGALGAIVGDSHEAAKRGAVLGAIAGALVPVNQQVNYGGVVGNGGYAPLVNQGVNPMVGNVPMPAGASCPFGTYWDGSGRGCRNNNQLIPNQQQALPRGAVCGAAALRMMCPSIQISGTNCRRCM